MAFFLFGSDKDLASFYKRLIKGMNDKNGEDESFLLNYLNYHRNIAI